MNLERASHIAFIGACLVLVAIGVARYRGFESGPKATEGVSRGRLVGQVSNSSSGTFTVFVAVSSVCSFCTESMAFYGRLVDTVKSNHRSVRVVFGSVEPVATTIRYLAEHAVKPDEIIGLPDTIPIKGTPTLLVVDERGVVKDGWLGRLTAQQERALIGMLPR